VDALAPAGWWPDQGVRPSYPEPAFSLALCDAAAGRLEAAVALLEHALASENLTSEAIATLTYNLGDSYHALGRLEDAVRAYQRALELHPSVSLYRFSLAVALDRDEQGARAREEMLTALAADRALASISQPTTIFVPPEDEDYFRGFALEVLSQSDLQKSACQPWLCRAVARVYFRRFLRRAPESAWRPRVEAHLHDLGEGAPREDEISVLPATGRADATLAAPYVKAVTAVLPKLRACLDEKPMAVLRADVFLPGKTAPAAPPAPARKGEPLAIKPPTSEKSITVLNAGPLPDEPARVCVAGALAAVKWPAPAQGPLRVQFAVSGP